MANNNTLVGQICVITDTNTLEGKVLTGTITNDVHTLTAQIVIGSSFVPQIGDLDSAPANDAGLAFFAGKLSTQSASSTHPGMVNTNTQTFAGNKTFTGVVTAPAFVGHLSGTSDTAINLAGGSGGSIPYQSLTGTTAMLENGTLGQLLQSNGATLPPSWVTSTSSPLNSASPLTTKGDLYGYTTTNARIPVGTNAYTLVADSTQALGLKWAQIDLTAGVTGVLPNANTTATNTNTASTIVSRDSSGNFSAGTITASLAGNASTATTAANISSNISESQVTNLVSDLNLKSPLESPTFTGTVTAPTFVGALTGNASTSTTFTGNLSGDLTSSGMVTTLATVNSSSGSFGTEADVVTVTVNAKGLVTAVTEKPILITESQVTNLVSDLFLKAPLASPTFTGTVTAPTFVGNLTGHSSSDLALTGGTLSGDLSLGTNRIHSVSDPVSAQDAATKNYVDTTINALSLKKESVYASTATVVAVYANGAAGVGATLTGVGVGALVIDGNTPDVGDRVLIKNQTSGFQNGIYNVTTAGDVSTAFVITRTTDFNKASQILAGASTYIVNGDANADTTWALSTIGTIVIGTTNLVLVQVSGPGSYTSGTGINITGTVVALANPSPSTIGGIQSLAAVNSKWINSISTSGVPSLTQPAFTDISGTVTNSMLAGSIDLTSKVTGILPNTNTTAASTNTASTIVARDNSGNFSAGTITANLTGNASTVTTNANLTGDVTSSGNITTLTNAPVIAKVLTGYVSGSGTVAATDSILQAFQKINGNVAALVSGVSSVFGRAGAVVANAGDYTVSQVTGAAPLASPTFTGTVTMPTPFTLGAISVTTTGTQLNYLNTATGTTGTTSTNLVFSTSPTFVTPTLGAATATSINKVTITLPATTATLTIGDGKTFECDNTLTLTATDGSILAIGAGGTLGSNAYTSTSYAPINSPTFTGTVTIPSGSALATPATLVGTNISGTAANLTAGNVTTNANLTGPVTSVGNATTIGAGAVTNSMLAGSIDLASKVTGILPNTNTTADSANTASTIVNRDSSGNFSAGTITASLAGNALTVTTNANLTGPIASVGNATVITSQTGTGSKIVVDNSPTLITPNIGTATGSASLNLLLTGGTLSGALSLGSNLINSVSDPVSAQDCATKNYVDTSINALSLKKECIYATTGALPAVVYANGSSGVGATLTGVALGALSIDSNSPSVADRVLVKNQVSNLQNGIYTVTATGSGAAVFVMTRATDFNQTSEIAAGAGTYIVNGTVNADTTFALSTTGTITIGTTALVFAQVSGPGSYTAGTGIGITGTVITLANPSPSTIGGIQSIAAVTSKWINSISTSGVPSLTQPAVADVSGAAPLASPTFTGTVTIPTPFTLGAISVTATGTQLNYLSAATGTTGTTSTNLVFSTSPTLVTPTLGAATVTSVNKMAITAPATASTLAVADGKTLTCSNTLTLTSTDGSTLAIGSGGTLGSNAYTSTAYAPLASPTFTGTVTANYVLSSTLQAGGTVTTALVDFGVISAVGKITSFGYATNSNHVGLRAQGTEASPSTVTNGLTVLQISSGGYDSTGWFADGVIKSISSETWSGTAHGSLLAFSTVANTTTSLVERMRINASGEVGIGMTAVRTLDVTGTFGATGAATFGNTVSAATFIGNLTGNASTATSLSGVLPQANGGTGLTSVTAIPAIAIFNFNNFS